MIERTGFKSPQVVGLILCPNSERPERFELAIRDAFRYLGFEAERLGGPGRTDVLISYSSGPGEYKTVVVDTKASSSMMIEEKNINFDTIGEHRERHKADQACIVGPSFHQSRLPSWARQRGVALIDAAVIAEMLERQDSTALGTRELARVFDAETKPEKVLEEEWKTSERRHALFGRVLAALSRESQEADEVTHGSLSLDNIYFLLRNELDARPRPSDIEAVVQFLSSPLLAAVSSPGKDKYVSDEHPSTVARKLRALALAAQQAADLSG